MSLTGQEKKDMDKFIKFLCLKSTQIIVQGRLGRKVTTKSIATPSGAEWFNLAIKDYPEIQREAKAALSNGIPNTEQSLVIEISLRTSDADSLVLEVWSIGLTNKYEDVRIHHTVYNRMSMLLRSLLSVSRVTPAYKLSRQQGNEYVICYRVYMGQVSLSGLGEGFQTLRVGSVSSPAGTITMSAAYRTSKHLHVSTKELKTQMIMNHNASAARPCHTLTSRLRTLSGTSDTFPYMGKGSSSPSFNVFCTSASDSPNAADQMKEPNSGATFTIGTPPIPTQSPPYEAPRNPASSFRIQKSLNSNHLHGYNQVGDDAKHILSHGFSAPAMHPHNFPTEVIALQSNHLSPPGGTVHQGETTYRHWNNSNATKVKANSVLMSTNPKTLQNVVQASQPEKVVMGWKDNHGIETGRNVSTNSPSFPVTGAFVSGSKTASRAKQSLREAEALTLPFSDLVNLAEVSDDNNSQKSDSDNGFDDRGMETDLQKKSESNESLSTKQSSTNSSVNQARCPEDFVMVDLKPAFGRDDSVGDLATFYRECENVPELVMFEDQKGTETEETLLDLTKELKDFEQDIPEFDEFISELQT